MENFGFLSILPIIIAVAMAIKTKNVILSLFTSVFAGVMILLNYNPLATTKALMTDYFLKQLTDSYNAGVIVLMLFIGGFIELMMRSGGAYAFAQSVGKLINSKTKSQLAAYLAGIIIFFSDLGTPLIVGPIFAPFFKKLKVSKEKLAFILDSTSSPIAVLVPFIGWGVFIIGLLQKEFETLGLTISDYGAFVKAIPFNIYPILALVIIPALALMKLDFGPMKVAEENIANDIELEIKEKKEYIVENAKPIYVWLPILILITTLFVMLGYDFMFRRFSGSEFRAALSSGYLYAAVVLAIMMLINKSKSFEEIFSIYLNGVTKMTQITIILILAWSLGTVNKHLGSADYIVHFMKSINLSGGLIPAIAFILGCIISFATGSSWGTYSIMIPIVIPMAMTLNAPLYVTIGAILSGGLFGDHCSPISDTTILASAGSGCSHIEHVRTQIFYAILNGILAFIGFLVGGFFQSYIILIVCIIIQISILVSIKIKQKI